MGQSVMSVVASRVEPFSKYSVRWLVTLNGAVSHVPKGGPKKAKERQEGRTLVCRGVDT